MRTYLISEIASLVGGKYSGSSQTAITGLATLSTAKQGNISFFSNTRYKDQLQSTKASVVLLTEEHAKLCPVDFIVVKNPYAAYATISHFFDTFSTKQKTGIHSTAYIAKDVKIDSSVSIGPNSVIHSGVVIGENVVIGSGVVVHENAQIGSGCILYDNVSIYHDVILHDRVVVHSGVVIGSDGFGFAPNEGKWLKIAQLGSVIIHSDVEIGANTTIDRGALDDTVIGTGVKLDNQIQIGHNVTIGDHTVIAGCTGIAGSTHIGKRCIIGGGACIGGHLQIADNVTITAMAGVSNSLKKPGIYSSGINAQENDKWRRNTVRLRNIEDYIQKLLKLEKTIQNLEVKLNGTNNEH